MFDIVIPVGPNDNDIIQHQLEYTKKNIIGYRTIFLICYDSLLQMEDCITVSENLFPFSIDTVSKFHGKVGRNGWYLQQLLKLYAGFVIPDILDTYLVIDSDTFFLKPTTFIENNICLYNFGFEYHIPYFQHMQKLGEIFKKQFPDKSGICHHMIFEKKYIKEIFEIVEKEHHDLFYNIFLKNVTEVNGSGASEYEIYFNYMIYKNLDKIKLRKLNWINTNSLSSLEGEYDYISYHWYTR